MNNNHSLLCSVISFISYKVGVVLLILPESFISAAIIAFITTSVAFLTKILWTKLLKKYIDKNEME